MRAESLERGFGIRFCRGCNVTALGVEDDGNHRTESLRLFLNRFDDLLERGPAFGAEDFEERRVGFECRSVGSGLFDEIQAEVQSGSGSGRRLRSVDVRVKSNA